MPDLWLIRRAQTQSRESLNFCYIFEKHRFSVYALKGLSYTDRFGNTYGMVSCRSAILKHNKHQYWNSVKGKNAIKVESVLWRKNTVHSEKFKGNVLINQVLTGWCGLVLFTVSFAHSRSDLTWTWDSPERPIFQQSIPKTVIHGSFHRCLLQKAVIHGSFNCSYSGAVSHRNTVENSASRKSWAKKTPRQRI